MVRKAKSERDEYTVQLGKLSQKRLDARTMLVAVRAVLKFVLRRLDTLFDGGAISFLGRNSRFGQQGATRRQDVGKTAEHNIARYLAVDALDCHDTRLDRRHCRRMIGHDGHLAFRCRKDDFADALGKQQALRRDEFEIEISHDHSLLLALPARNPGRKSRSARPGTCQPQRVTTGAPLGAPVESH